MKKILIIILVLGGFSFAFGQSTVGDSTYVTLISYAECDSARVFFGYPDTNLYRSVKLIPPISANSMLLRGRTELDSIGDHYVKILYYLLGSADTNYYIGKWLNSVSTLAIRDTSHLANTNAILASNYAKAGRDTINAHAPHGNNWASTGGGGSADTTAQRTMMRNNWDSDVDGKLSIEDVAGGTGSNSVIVRCKSSADSSVIPSANIQILDSTESSTVGLLTSDSQGRGFFALDNGTYCVRMSKPGGWQFTVPETLKVDGNEDTTYYADVFNPGSPPSAEYCLVYGWVDTLGLPVDGANIVASIDYYPLTYDTTLLANPYAQFTTTDSTGYWKLNLYINSLLTPATTKYQIWIYIPQGNLFHSDTVVVPNQPSWELPY